MSIIFPIVSGLNQLASAKEGEAEALRREFRKGFAEGAEDVAALRAGVGETVGLLIGVVKADRLQTEKVCQGVVNIQISGRWAGGAGQEKGVLMQPLHCDQWRISVGLCSPGTRRSHAGCSPLNPPLFHQFLRPLALCPLRAPR